jgi:hypothetical protein
MAMSLRTDVMLGSYIIYEDEQNDEAYSAWHLEAMKALEPFTVGQYWGDSDQTRRGENSDRRRMGASAADPYAARPERPVRRLPRRSRRLPQS